MLNSMEIQRLYGNEFICFSNVEQTSCRYLVFTVLFSGNAKNYSMEAEPEPDFKVAVESHDDDYD